MSDCFIQLLVCQPLVVLYPSIRHWPPSQCFVVPVLLRGPPALMISAFMLYMLGQKQNKKNRQRNKMMQHPEIFIGPQPFMDICCRAWNGTSQHETIRHLLGTIVSSVRFTVFGHGTWDTWRQKPCSTKAAYSQIGRFSAMCSCSAH
jgi:hypothetical protein